MLGTIRLIKTWATGHVEGDVGDGQSVSDLDGSLAVVLEREEHVDALTRSGVIGTDSRVFVPGIRDSDEVDAGPVVIGYEGSLSDPGGDVQIGAHFFLQSQDYGTSEYLSLIGNTLIRIVDESDFDAFVEDADRAKRDGEFPDFATHPMVRLCDLGSLGAPGVEGGPQTRLFVDRDGGISTAPTGTRIGAVGDDLESLTSAWSKINTDSFGGCAVALAGVVPEEKRQDALERRAWLGRYHVAVAGLRDLRGRNIAELKDVRVSGFGHRLNDELDDVVETAEDGWNAPVLMWTSTSAYLHDWSSEKTFQLGHEAGRLAERLLVSGGVDAAADGDASELQTVVDFFQRGGISLTRP